jgi:predicted phage gp36 major capsid-like protein
MAKAEKSVEQLEQDVLALEDKKAALRDEQRALTAEIARKKEEEEMGLIEAYWYQRLLDNPNDSDALRAKASLLDRDASGTSNVVRAATAIVSGKAEN